MEVDTRQQPLQPPHMSNSQIGAGGMSGSQPQGQFANSNNNNYYPQPSNDPMSLPPGQPPPPPPPQLATNQQEMQAQTPYQKHQPLIDQSGPMSPDFNESPTVGFSTNNDYSAQHADEPYSSLSSTTRSLNMRYQIFLDKISPHWKARWAFSLLALVVFMARVVVAQGCPKVDPGMGLDDDDDLAETMLPTHANDEFRPFIRRVPEFKFWISGTKATLLSLFLSLFDIFDVPVFWPILLIYFVILFACTMREQIKHMIRYRYVPWDSGKKKYTGGRTASDEANLYPQTV